MRYSELFEKSLGKITPTMREAVDNCISAMRRDKLSDVELYAITGSVHSTFEVLARSVAQELENVIEAAQQSSRLALKAQAVTFALKLETSRTAAAVTLEARATELEADMHRKLEEALRAMAEGSLFALRADARRAGGGTAGVGQAEAQEQQRRRGYGRA